MSKMAPLVGRDITERYFLPRFELLCSDPLFHVRKVRKKGRIVKRHLHKQIFKLYSSKSDFLMAVVKREL